MSSYTTISPDKLARLIGTANMPVLIDVRTDEDFAADPRLIPGAAHQRRGQTVRAACRCRWLRTLAIVPQARPSGPPAFIRHHRLPALRVWS